MNERYLDDETPAPLATDLIGPQLEPMQFPYKGQPRGFGFPALDDQPPLQEAARQFLEWWYHNTGERIVSLKVEWFHSGSEDFTLYPYQLLRTRATVESGGEFVVKPNKGD